MFNFFKNKNEVKVLQFDRPVLVSGIELKEKVRDKLVSTKKQIDDITHQLNNNTNRGIEGSRKNGNKRELQEKLRSLNLHCVWLKQLLVILVDNYQYTLNISEVHSLGFLDLVD